MPEAVQETIDLSEFFRTKSEANDFSSRLAAVSEKLYQTGFDLEKALLEQFGIQKKDKFLTLLRSNNISQGSNIALKDFFTKLQQKAVSAPVLSLIIAFEPDEQTLKGISEWLALNVHEQVLLDIKVDRKLVAGTSINYKGKFLDYALKPKVDELINATLAKMAQAKAPPQEQPTKHQNVEHISIGR